MPITATQLEVIQALSRGKKSRSEIAKFNNRKEGATCARVSELCWYLQPAGTKIDPKTKARVEVLALNGHGLNLAAKHSMRAA